MGGFTQSLAVLSSRLHRHPLATPDKDSTAGLAIRAKLVSHALFGGSAWAYFSVSVVQVFSVSAGARFRVPLPGPRPCYGNSRIGANQAQCLRQS